MQSLVIGFGEIGKAVAEVIGAIDTVNTYDYRQPDDRPALSSPVQVMHICFPYSETFVADVRTYIQKYDPQYVFIWSTVQVYTCIQIGGNVMHTPVEGKHPQLAQSIRTMRRWVSGNTDDELAFAEQYFRKLGMKTKLVPNTNWTEALKLLSTTEYGLNIEFARYKARVAYDVGMDYELTKEWNRSYNRLYYKLGLDDRYAKYVLDAPDGAKGGHCVTPNAQLLYEKFPDALVKQVAEL